MNKNDMRLALRGASLLVTKGHFEKLTSIEVGEFELRKADNCIIYHIFGSYLGGLGELGLPSGRSYDYGFNFREDEETREYCCEGCDGDESEFLAGNGQVSWKGLDEAWGVIILALRQVGPEKAVRLLGEMMVDNA